MQKSTRNPLEFIENVKTDLFPDEVYVFTPKGTILELPAGSTAVDFAYTIHSDIGNSCVAAKLDRRLAPLSTPLTSGQQVEIITTIGARPNPAWLNFVVTGRAKSHIKHFLKKQHREESMGLGKRLLDKALNSLGLSLAQIPEQQLKTIVSTALSGSLHHFLEDIGLGNRNALLAAKLVAGFLNNSGEAHIQDTSIHPLAIKGTEGLVITYAKCCRPIPGDPISGYLEAGQGIIVHVENCALLENYRHLPDKFVSLTWEDKVHGDFSVDLRVDILNQRGSLASLAQTIADAESNIENINAEEFDGHYFSVSLTISAHDRIHLAKILRKTRKNKNVIRVIRYKPQARKKTKTSLPL